MKTHTTPEVTGVDGITRWMQVHTYDDGRTVVAAYSQAPTQKSASTRWSNVFSPEDSQDLGMALLGKDIVRLVPTDELLGEGG